jgi:hypothetical protein
VWSNQFYNAIAQVGGGDDDDDDNEDDDPKYPKDKEEKIRLSPATLVIHYLSSTWKLIAACVPPADW